MSDAEHNIIACGRTTQQGWRLEGQSKKLRSKRWAGATGADFELLEGSLDEQCVISNENRPLSPQPLRKRDCKQSCISTTSLTVPPSSGSIYRNLTCLSK